MNFELTFHWFEIELVAIPATLIYYYVAHKFFLLHRKKSSIGANIFISSMKKKLSALATNFAEAHDRLAAKYSKDVSSESHEDGKSKYFFQEDHSETDEGYDDLMYDEDQQNHLRNLKNGAELFSDLASAQDNKTISVLGDNLIKNGLREFTVKEEGANDFNFR